MIPSGNDRLDAAAEAEAQHMTEMQDEALTPQLKMFRAAVARFREAGQLDGVTPFGWFLAGMGAVDTGAPFERIRELEGAITDTVVP